MTKSSSTNSTGSKPKSKGKGKGKGKGKRALDDRNGNEDTEELQPFKKVARIGGTH